MWRENLFFGNSSEIFRTDDGRMHGNFSNGRTDGRIDGRTDGRTKKKRKIQSVSQTIDLVVTIRNLAESSKSELSSRGKRPFKVYIRKFFVLKFFPIFQNVKIMKMVRAP